eukprot:scaffold22141_cov64-Phaeocystis_antarctica.AAC.3
MQLEFGEPADDGCARPGLWLDTLGLACGRAVPCGAWSAECGVRRAPGPQDPRVPALLRRRRRVLPRSHACFVARQPHLEEPKSATPMPSSWQEFQFLQQSVAKYAQGSDALPVPAADLAYAQDFGLGVRLRPRDRAGGRLRAAHAQVGGEHRRREEGRARVGPRGRAAALRRREQARLKRTGCKYITCALGRGGCERNVVSATRVGAQYSVAHSKLLRVERVGVLPSGVRAQAASTSPARAAQATAQQHTLATHSHAPPRFFRSASRKGGEQSFCVCRSARRTRAVNRY